MRAFLGSALATAVLCLLAVSPAEAQGGTEAGVASGGVRVQSAALVGEAGVPTSAPSRDAESPGAAAPRSPAVLEEVGPTTRGAAVGARATVPERTDRAILASIQDRPRVGHSKALMIAGGAALVAGLIIGDDAGAVLAVGGAVVGLYGLYLFVR